MSHFKFFVKVYSPAFGELDVGENAERRQDRSGNVPVYSFRDAQALVNHLDTGGYRAEVWTTIYTLGKAVNVPVEGLLQIALDLKEHIESTGPGGPESPFQRVLRKTV